MQKKKKSIPYAVFKPTGFGRFALYQKLTEKKELTVEEKSEWIRVVARFHTVCKAAVAKDVPLLIDAEESWMQDAADNLVEELMETYNKEKAIVFNTLQMYRHDRMDYLRGLHQKAYQKGYHIGMKVVTWCVYGERARKSRRKKDMIHQSVTINPLQMLIITKQFVL